MLIKGVEVTVEDAIEFANVNRSFLKRRKNGLLLSDYQISVLERNNIDYKKFNNMSSLLLAIEDNLNILEDEELEEVSKQLSEMHYYMETNK